MPTAAERVPRRAGWARWPERFARRLEYAAALGAHLLQRPGRPAPPVEPYVPGETPLARRLAWPVVLGFVASVLIFLGGTQPNSPFTFKHAGAWYFGIPHVAAESSAYTPAPGQWLFVGVVAVYAGMLLLLRAWFDVVRTMSRHPGVPVSRLVPVFVAWVLPLLVVAPLFSKDVYSYAAQGEMMAHGINPYHYGPSLLSSGSPFSQLVDPLWGNVSSPYGPVFLALAGGIVAASGHNVLLSVVGLRLLALAGTVLFACAVPVIARSFNRDAATAFALAALNPLVLLHLVAGAHNDALMLGLLVPGYALARRGHPVLGVALCGLAAAVKVPAILGAVYIGWEWWGPGRPVSERLRPTLACLAGAVGVMAVCSEAVGLGWGWISGLQNPDTVRSWLDPATGLGLFLGRVVSAVGLGDHTHVLLTICRGAAFVLAGLIGLRLLRSSDRIGALSAMGWTYVAVVLLGPVVQPWYAAWGFVFLAPIAEGRTRRVLLVVSGIACFVGLPGGRVLVDELANANPGMVALASGALVAFAAALVAPRLRRGLGGQVKDGLSAERA